jgi:hypothetical protein
MRKRGQIYLIQNYFSDLSNAHEGYGMKTLRDLKSLSRMSNNANFEEIFKELHHFSKHPPFSTKPSGFSSFIDYCERRPCGIRPGQENERTIQRACRYLETVRSGVPQREAKDIAWREFPIIKTNL